MSTNFPPPGSPGWRQETTQERLERLVNWDGEMIAKDAAGVLNLVWMAIITVFVLVEKLVPAGDRIGRYAGVLFIVWGIWLIVMELI